MMAERDVFSSGVVTMVLGAGLVLGVCAAVCSAVDSGGFPVDLLQHENLRWESKNAQHPKYFQMLNMVNLKSKNNFSLYGVQSVRTATEVDKGTHYHILFWPTNEKMELPSCEVKFFIPIFGRHRDMEIKSLTCEPFTHNKKRIEDATHLRLNSNRDLLVLRGIN